MGTLGHINGSGFPFQMAVEQHVNANTHIHGWKVVYSEHSWENKHSNSNGFIDLVFLRIKNHLPVYLVVECKKTKQGTNWIFLNDKNAREFVDRAKVLRLHKNSGMAKAEYWWNDVETMPGGIESQFCVIPSQGNAQIIERESSILTQSVEGLAEENIFLFNQVTNLDQVLVPIIITNTPLKEYRFNASDPNLLNTGELHSSEKLKDIGFVRFRKQLLVRHQLPQIEHPLDGSKIVSAKEQTVFIVNSEHLKEFLTNFLITS